jgi:hypothetical protein
VLIDNSQFDDNYSDAIQISALRQSTAHVTVQDSRWSASTQGSSGVVLTNSNDAALYADVKNNLGVGSNTSGFAGSIVVVGSLTTSNVAQLHGTVRNNQLTAPDSALNNTVVALIGGTSIGSSGSAFLKFDSNTINHYGTLRAIAVDTGTPTTNPIFHAIATNNVINSFDAVNGVTPLRISARQSSTGCFHVAQNSGSVATTGVPHTQVRQVSPAVATLQGSGASSAAVLAANHPALPGLTNVTGTVSLGANCTQATTPNLPAPAL